MRTNNVERLNDDCHVRILRRGSFVKTGVELQIVGPLEACRLAESLGKSGLWQVGSICGARPLSPSRIHIGSLSALPRKIASVVARVPRHLCRRTTVIEHS